MGDRPRVIRLEGGYTTSELTFTLADGREVHVSPDGEMNVTDSMGWSVYSLTLPTSEEVARACKRNGRRAVDDTPDYTVGVEHHC